MLLVIAIEENTAFLGEFLILDCKNITQEANLKAGF